MSAPHDATRAHLQRVAGDLPPAEIARRLAPKHDPAPPRVPGATQTGPDVVAKRWALLPGAAGAQPVLADAATLAGHEGFARNVGSSRVDLQACKLEYSIVSPK